MLKRAQEAKNQYFPHIKLLAITAMTSLDDEDTSYIYDETAKNSVLKLAKLALDS
jgi:orotidine-5'-phosphate decarboxylase